MIRGFCISLVHKFTYIYTYILAFMLEERKRTLLKEAIASMTSLVNVFPCPDVPIKTDLSNLSIREQEHILK